MWPICHANKFFYLLQSNCVFSIFQTRSNTLGADSSPLRAMTHDRFAVHGEFALLNTVECTINHNDSNFTCFDGTKVHIVQPTFICYKFQRIRGLIQSRGLKSPLILGQAATAIRPKTNTEEEFATQLP